MLSTLETINSVHLSLCVGAQRRVLLIVGNMAFSFTDAELQSLEKLATPLLVLCVLTDVVLHCRQEVVQSRPMHCWQVS